MSIHLQTSYVTLYVMWYIHPLECRISSDPISEIPISHSLSQRSQRPSPPTKHINICLVWQKMMSKRVKKSFPGFSICPRRSSAWTCCTAPCPTAPAPSASPATPAGSPWTRRRQRWRRGLGGRRSQGPSDGAQRLMADDQK